MWCSHIVLMLNRCYIYIHMGFSIIHLLTSANNSRTNWTWLICSIYIQLPHHDSSWIPCDTIFTLIQFKRSTRTVQECRIENTVVHEAVWLTQMQIDFSATLNLNSCCRVIQNFILHALKFLYLLVTTLWVRIHFLWKNMKVFESFIHVHRWFGSMYAKIIIILLLF